MNIDVDKIVVSLDVVAPDAVVVEASAVAPSGIVTEAVAELPTQVIVISHEETPTVTPLQIIDFGSSSIECAFDVTTEQADEVVKGVLCGTINPPTFENADYRLLHGQGSMDLAFAGLHQNTEYYLRPYALSNLGYKYGDVVAQRTKNSPIPEEYQLVEYLESTGTQYLDFDDIYNDYVDFECEVVEWLYPNKNSALFGNYYNNQTEIFIQRLSQSNLLFSVGRSSRQTISISNFSGTYRFTEDLSTRNGFLKKDETIYVDSTLSYTPNYQSIHFLKSNTDTGAANYNYFYGKIGKIIKRNKEGDFLSRRYPVYRKSDNKPGMYDIVDNLFYVNQGTGDFIVGPDKEFEEE